MRRSTEMQVPGLNPAANWNAEPSEVGGALVSQAQLSSLLPTGTLSSPQHCSDQQTSTQGSSHGWLQVTQGRGEGEPQGDGVPALFSHSCQDAHWLVSSTMAAVLQKQHARLASPNCSRMEDVQNPSGPDCLTPGLSRMSPRWRASRIFEMGWGDPSCSGQVRRDLAGSLCWVWRRTQQESQELQDFLPLETCQRPSHLKQAC